MRPPCRLTAPAAIATALLLAIPSAAEAQDLAPAASTETDSRTAIDRAVETAALRFGIPTAWIRQVMRAESDGNPWAVSRAGALGLMQLMPATYAELRARHGLGADPFHIGDNVMAGTAYLRELYDRYGARGMLAAYNAGPGRWQDHVGRGRPLPGETMMYLAKLGPLIDEQAVAEPPRAAGLAIRSSPTDLLFAVRRAPAPLIGSDGVADTQAVATRPGPDSRPISGAGSAFAPAQNPPSTSAFAAEATRAERPPNERLSPIDTIVIAPLGALFVATSRQVARPQ